MQKNLFVKIATVCLFSVSSFSVIAGSFLFTKTSNHAGKTQIITDISRYPEIRNHKWSNLQQIEHFPLKIPDDAKFLSMAYSSGLIPGSGFFQIRLQHSPAEIQKLLSYYSKNAVKKYQGGDTNDHIKYPNGLPTTFFYTSQSQVEAFPNSYQILVLNAEDKSKGGFKWNRGNSYGVAIDSAAGEIIYWVEQW
jgi:hypothetical protein